MGILFAVGFFILAYREINRQCKKFYEFVMSKHDIRKALLKSSEEATKANEAVVKSQEELIKVLKAQINLQGSNQNSEVKTNEYVHLKPRKAMQRVNQPQNHH